MPNPSPDVRYLPMLRNAGESRWWSLGHRTVQAQSWPVTGSTSRPSEFLTQLPLDGYQPPSGETGDSAVTKDAWTSEKFETAGGTGRSAMRNAFSASVLGGFRYSFTTG